MSKKKIIKLPKVDPTKVRLTNEGLDKEESFLETITFGLFKPKQR